MAEVKWIKIVTDIFDDEKMLLIESLPGADSLIVIWFKLLCLAGKNNNDGVFIMNNKIPYTEEMLSTIFRREINTVRLALKTFEDFGMIEIVDGVITIPNWNKHQTLDSYEKKKEYDRLRQAERRRKQKEIVQKSCDKSCDSNTTPSCDVVVSDKEVDKEEDKKHIGRTKFTPPTLEEVQAYCKERGNKVDAKAFFDYFTTGGWKDSKGNPVKNWKQKIITWEKFEPKDKPKKENTFNQMIHTDYDFDAIEKELLK